MKNWLKFCSLPALALVALLAFAQPTDKAATSPGPSAKFSVKDVTVEEIPGIPSAATWHWSVEVVPSELRAGEKGVFRITCKIDPHYHTYSPTSKKDAEGNGPEPTVIKGASKDNALIFEKLQAPKPIKKDDPMFGLEVEYYEHEAVFNLPFKVHEKATGKHTVRLSLTAAACNDTQCLGKETSDIEITFDLGGPTSGQLSLPGAKNKDLGPIGEDGSVVILPFLLAAIGAGLASLFTPCVFPMIPITVSFFSKQRPDGTPAHGIKGAFAYCAGIIITFTGLGMLATLLLGASGINEIANNPILNICLAVLFIVLSLSLFGFFELAIPSGLANKLTQKGNKSSGLLAPLLMGFAFSITSFTCTGPFVGGILAVAAKTGNYLYPALGMFVFSLFFSLPFFLLARFPGYLANLPKSGSWLSTVKVFMGFLELAAAIKFLSIADIILGEGFLPAPTFLALWGGIFALAAFYLFGWIRLPKEGEPKIGILRRGVAGSTALLAIYCFLAINRTVPLAALGGFMPNDPFPYNAAALARMGLKDDKKYWEEEGLVWWKSLEYAKEKAAESGKPIFVDFTGYNCVNCRDMEKTIFIDKEVHKRFGENFVLAKLHVDRLTDPTNVVNKKLQYEIMGNVAMPGYAILSPDGTLLARHAYDKRQPVFLEFLSKGIDPGVSFKAEPYWLEQDLKWLQSIESAKREAARTGKTIFVNFTGYNMPTSVRSAEQTIFADEAVNRQLNENFILAKLFTDRLSDPSNIENRKFHLALTNSPVLPSYILLTPDGRKIASHGYTASTEELINFLSKNDENPTLAMK